MNNDTSIVCTRCYTYNHEPYIKDALNGFAMQKTVFPVVTVVIDDASTDKTPEVIRQFIKEHCDLQAPEAYEKDTGYAWVTYAPLRTNPNNHFAIVYLKENHYSQKKSKLSYLTEWMNPAKYQAFCEGDDYWTDPLKLQKQVDFLETHPEHSMCFHKADAIFWPSGELSPLYQNLEEKDYTIDEIAENWIVPTASVVYRSIFQNKIPINKKFIHGDIVLFLTMATNGKVHCLGDKMSIYRRVSSGSVLTNTVKDKKSALHNLKLAESWKEMGKCFSVSKRIVQKNIKRFQCFYLSIELRNRQFKSILFDNTSITLLEKIKLFPLLLENAFKSILSRIKRS